MRIQSLHIYPVKGARGVQRDTAQVNLRGFEHDRRWIVTDTENVFFTQRTLPSLVRLSAEPENEFLNLTMDGAGQCRVPTPSDGDRRKVTVWADQVEAVAADPEASAWLSQALGREVCLYYMDAEAERHTPIKWGAPAPVSFADAFPFLITTTASLDALNEELAKADEAPVGMERFRPNIVIDTADPWAEDYWRKIKIGNVEVDLVKPCDRCVVTTIDQGSGEKTGREPLRTLSKIRQSAHPELDGVLFGWNAAPITEGKISAGDEVKILKERQEGWPLVSPQ